MSDAELLEMLKAFRQTAVERERIEIARMLEDEAAKHEQEAESLREKHGDGDADNEASLHDYDARLLDSFAKIIRART